jgi:hypothetical protein
MEINKHLLPWMEISKDSVCLLQNDPTLLSEEVISETMRRHEAIAMNIRDARSLIQDYLHVLCERI